MARFVARIERAIFTGFFLDFLVFALRRGCCWCLAVTDQKYEQRNGVPTSSTLGCMTKLNCLRSGINSVKKKAIFWRDGDYRGWLHLQAADILVTDDWLRAFLVA